MKWKITCVVLAALASSGCEHPFANGGMRGASPVELAAVPATDEAQAMVASATLHALLGAELEFLAETRGLLGTGSAPVMPHAANAWLETQSVALQGLAERSRSAWLAAGAPRNP